ncbi:MAG: proton-conducting transporter membrane subunit, partial [Solirubrobacteraceae bacterium]
FGTGSLLRGYDTKEVEGVTNAGRAMPWTGPMFLAAALALSGLPLSGVFRSEFQIVAGGFQQSQYVGVTLLIVFVNLAFLGVVWHTGRMVLSPPATVSPGGAVVPAARERSAWMVVGMLGCLIVVVALGVHLPGDLSALLTNAGHRLAAPG